jgi:hypothetical protein
MIADVARDEVTEEKKLQIRLLLARQQ